MVLMSLRHMVWSDGKRLGVDEHTFVGMASVSFSPLATGFREIDGYFHILGPGAPWSGAEPCGLRVW